MNDILRELMIRLAMFVHVRAYRVMRWTGEAHKTLIYGRSESQVERMEKARGLR